jgi:hypothetical protein
MQFATFGWKILICTLPVKVGCAGGSIWMGLIRMQFILAWSRCREMKQLKLARLVRSLLSVASTISQLVRC